LFNYQACKKEYIKLIGVLEPTKVSQKLMLFAMVLISGKETITFY